MNTKAYLIFSVTIVAIFMLQLFLGPLAWFFRRWLVPWGRKPITSVFVFRSQPSSRMHTLVAISYIILNIVYISVATSLRGAANRSGLLGLVNLIPTYAFARMNFLINTCSNIGSQVSIIHSWLSMISLLEIYFHGLYYEVTKIESSALLHALFTVSTIFILCIITIQIKSIYPTFSTYAETGLHILHLIGAASILPLCGLHVGWPFIMAPAISWALLRLLIWFWIGYLRYYRPSVVLYQSINYGGSPGAFNQYQIQFSKPRVFSVGQYFLINDTRWRYLGPFGLLLLKKVYISGVESSRQRNYPFFEAPVAKSAIGDHGTKHRFYIEGPYGGLDLNMFTQCSSAYILIAEDLGLGRQLFLLDHILDCTRRRRTKIFLIWIISQYSYGPQLLQLFSWSMKDKNNNIESRVRDMPHIALYIRICGYAHRMKNDPRNKNIHISTHGKRYLDRCVPDIKGGISYQKRGLNDDDLSFTSLSICGPPQVIAGFEILRSEWVALQRLQNVDKAFT